MITPFPFEIKAVSDEGTFTGLASTFGGAPDSYGDIVQPGAFTRTLQQSGAERPLLWQHRDPVGLVKLRESAEGLIAEGRLSLGIQQARDALVLLKDGVVRSMSIGFSTVKERFESEVRHLLEVKLWEVSLVVTPANPAALITSVKNVDEIRRALDSFRSEVKRAIQPR